MSAFKTILFKEIKSMIRDPKILIAMIITPVIITGLMYGIMIFSTQQMIKETLYARGIVVVLDEDHGYWARNLTNYLKEIGYKVEFVESRNELLSIIRNRSIACGIIIPRGFTENITLNKSAYVNVYIYIASPSMTYLTSRTKILSIIDRYSENITNIFIKTHGLNPEYVLNPLNSTIKVIIRDKTIALKDLGSIIGSLMIVNMGFPLIALILASFLVQLTATSIAVEKEEKMFETILSLPISRLSFIAAKIVASVIIGLLSVFIYGALFTWYFTSLSALPSSSTTSQTTSEASTSIVSAIASIYGSGGVALLVFSLFGLVLFILGVSIILALFVEDVRSAQIITSYIVLPLVIIMIMNMFLDLSSFSESMRHLIALIPLINTCLVSTYLFLGDYLSVYLAVSSSIIYALIVMYIASKLVTTEKVFVLKPFRRKRRR